MPYCWPKAGSFPEVSILSANNSTVEEVIAVYYIWM